MAISIQLIFCFLKSFTDLFQPWSGVKDVTESNREPGTQKYGAF